MLLISLNSIHTVYFIDRNIYCFILIACLEDKISSSYLNTTKIEKITEEIEEKISQISELKTRVKYLYDIIGN